jgi:RNA binding exosome subunit
MSEEDSIKFSAAEISLVFHATEDEGKVLKAIEDMLLVPSKRFSSSPSEGQYFRVMMQARWPRGLSHS